MAILFHFSLTPRHIFFLFMQYFYVPGLNTAKRYNTLHGSWKLGAHLCCEINLFKAFVKLSFSVPLNSSTFLKYLCYLTRAQHVLSYHLVKVLWYNPKLYNAIWLTYARLHLMVNKYQGIYYVFHILPPIYSANHATFPVQMYVITV